MVAYRQHSMAGGIARQREGAVRGRAKNLAALMLQNSTYMKAWQFSHSLLKDVHVIPRPPVSSHNQLALSLILISHHHQHILQVSKLIVCHAGLLQLCVS